MAEPTTPNIGLVVPNTGDLVGTWGTAAVNTDFIGIDGMFGGVASIFLFGSSIVTLTTNGATFAPTSGPNQSQNALLNVTGTLSGSNGTIKLTAPGVYRFFNGIYDFTDVVIVASVNGGKQVGLPPGEVHTLFHDGTNVIFLDLERVGAQINITGLTGLANWMVQTTPAPYLIRDGSIHNIADFPALGALLGSTFGGDGSTTFAVPDSRARADVGFDTGSTGRLTGTGGVTGTTMGSAGGNQGRTLTQANLPNVNFNPNTSPVSTNQSNIVFGTPASVSVATGSTPIGVVNGATSGAATVTPPPYSSGGSGSAVPTVQPTIVSYIPLIKT